MTGHLWLIGMMGSGKSTIAALLGARLGRPVVDIDTVIEARLGCSIPQLWGERGERAFRDLESAAVDRVAAGVPAVIATGGGVVLDPASVERMRTTGSIVWLTASPPVLRSRVGSGSGRPLLETDDPGLRLEAILASRRDLYAGAADLTVDTDDASAAETADRIEAWWNAS
jgi:shikimate kinase